MAKRISKKVLSLILISGITLGNISVINADTKSINDNSSNSEVNVTNKKVHISLKPGINKIEIVKGTDVNLLSYITATDIDGTDITGLVYITTNLNPYEVGVYDIKYTVTSPKGNTDFLYTNVYVVEPSKNNDWKNHWASNYIKKGMDNNWIVTTDTFRPDDQLTRAEAVTMLNRVYKFKDMGEIPFEDVNPGHWYYHEVSKALCNGVISADSKFRPNDPVTREEFATMVSNIETAKKGDSNHDKYMKYKDYNLSSDWAKNSIEYTIEKGYMGAGGEYFNALNNITRAEAITTLVRAN